MRPVSLPGQAAWKCSALILAVSLVAIASVAERQSTTRHHRPFFEAYPETIQQRIEARDRLLAGQRLAVKPNQPPVTAQFVIKWIRKWPVGGTITVAFSGGSPEIRSRIESAAAEWTKYCNIKFDFREGGKFREWSTTDTEYKADIRIGFDQKGYWSALGTESIDPDVYYARNASMNFFDFLTTPPPPSSFNATVKHEFGHALGFEHEHQGPKEGCEGEIRWEDDAGYVPTKDTDGWYIADAQGRHPGVYTVYSAGPDPWDGKQVDGALKRLPNSRAYETSAFDPKSIMKYYLEPLILLKGEASRCYSSETTRISRLDREGAGKLYPRSASQVQQVINEQKNVLSAVMKIQGLPARAKQYYQSRLQSLH